MICRLAVPEVHGHRHQDRTTSHSPPILDTRFSIEMAKCIAKCIKTIIIGTVLSMIKDIIALHNKLLDPIPTAMVATTITEVIQEEVAEEDMMDKMRDMKELAMVPSCLQHFSHLEEGESRI